MTTCFDMNTTYEEIFSDILNRNCDNDIYTAHFITGDVVTFNKRKMTINAIAQAITDKVNAIKTALSEMIAADDKNNDDDEARYEAMYQDWLAEQEYKYDAQDATMHHFF